MPTIKRFEDILAWQEARVLAQLVYSLTSKQPLANDLGFSDQLRRAAISVGSNIAEGFARNGNKEFSKFLWIAKGSLAEVQSQLYVGCDIGYINKDDFENIFLITERCSYLIYKFLKTLRDSEISGERYKPSSTPTSSVNPP